MLKRKLIAAVTAAAMLAGSMTMIANASIDGKVITAPASAAQLQSSVSSAVEQLANASSRDRSAAFTTLKSSNDTQLKALADSFSGGFDTIWGSNGKDEVTFALNFFRAFSQEERQAALEEFDNRVELVSADGDFEDALARLAAKYSSQSARDKLASESELTPAVAVNMLKIFHGKVAFTDAADSSDLAVMYVNDDFSSKLAEVLADYTFDGEKLSSGKDIINYMTKSFNSVATEQDKTDLKVVFSAAGIYGKLFVNTIVDPKDDGTLSVHIGVENTAAIGIDAAIITAVYSDGVLTASHIDEMTGKFTLTPGAITSLNFGFTSDEAANADTVKVFIWDSAAGLVPIAAPSITAIE